jgi:Major intrinsic protein
MNRRHRWRFLQNFIVVIKSYYFFLLPQLHLGLFSFHSKALLFDYSSALSHLRRSTLIPIMSSTRKSGLPFFRRRSSRHELQDKPALAGTQIQSSGRIWKNHFIAASGEFCGTFQFLFFAFATHLVAVRQGGQGPNGGNNTDTVIFISLAYGFSLLVTAWVWYRISGGLFNPAVCCTSAD